MVTGPYGGVSRPTLETTSTGVDFIYLDGTATSDLLVGWHVALVRRHRDVVHAGDDGHRAVASVRPHSRRKHFFLGDLDDLRFYSCALGDAELSIVAGGCARQRTSTTRRTLNFAASLPASTAM